MSPARMAYHGSSGAVASASITGNRLQTVITEAGAGCLYYDGLAVTRRLGDPTCDREGLFFFVRDLDDGRFWSATLEPTTTMPASYAADVSNASASFRRLDHEIEVQTEVWLDAENDVELRSCRVVNKGERLRHIEVTSYLEWVLQDAAADAAHPAFSKLFVETQYLADLQAVVARRRVRDPAQQILCGAHWIAYVHGLLLEPSAEFETSRSDFIGRGRDLRGPMAMTCGDRLGGAQGPVLDPIASLRRSFVLHAGESAIIVFATTASAAGCDLQQVIRSVNAGGVLTSSSHRRAEDCQVSSKSDTAVNGYGAPLRVDHAHPEQRGTAYRRLPLESSRTVRVTASPEQLQFDNGLGGFSADGKEYVIRLRPDGDGRLTLPPLPWSHVVANQNAGFIATETGAGYTWTANSRENRLSHWWNDPVTDPHSEALYLRDADRGTYWSATPGPAPGGKGHEIRYGFGYVRFEQSGEGLQQRMLQFVPREDAIKISRVTVANENRGSRRLDLFAYAHLALGNGSREACRGVRTWIDETCGALFATNPARELSGRVAFAALFSSSGQVRGEFTCDRAEFIGRGGALTEPVALLADESLSGWCGDGLDACFALKQSMALPPSATAECWWMLGEAETEQEARALISKYSHAATADAAFNDVRDFWAETLAAIQIDTPSSALNLMVNGWLPYQNLSCRMWGRSAYYQSGGAYGFRDQLQDAAALIYHDPAITREQILRHAANQFIEGDVLHWWHPPQSRGIRTRFADDLLWLPLVASEYAASTGDDALWDVTVGYLTGPQLEPGEAERFFTPESSVERGTIYEHCTRAIDRALSTGKHGLPLFGCGDWNDGMNRVGEDGRGESVWMGFFLHHVLEQFLPVCEGCHDGQRAERYREHQKRLRQALNDAGWDGQWYLRAFFDDGEPLGTAALAECRIDALVQAWAVLSHAGEADKTEQAVAAVERHLVDEEARLIRLLDPPFDRMSQDPGYIKGYLPGVRENGGQYTHGVLWFVRAMAELGRGTRAVELLEMLNPINHARNASEMAVYQAEPYVVAADVYSQPPHAGRAGWTWYTGSAGWMFRVAVESILGLRIENGRELVLNPTISAKWTECRLAYRAPNGQGIYEIHIANAQGREGGVVAATLDGIAASVKNGKARIPLTKDGSLHRVNIEL